MRNVYYFILIILIFSSCDFLENHRSEKATEIPEGFFEGEITLTEFRGVYGRLFQVQTIYNISENKLKREEHFQVATQSLGDYAGIIVDLEKDSVVLYFADGLQQEYFKHTLKIEEYQAFIAKDTFPLRTPSPVDQTFKLLYEYQLISQVKDSTQIKGFHADYSFFKHEQTLMKQEVFDTKEIKVKRPILEMTFMDLPKEVNFPLVSDFRTMISDISNDSLIAGSRPKRLFKLTKKTFESDSTMDEKEELEKLTKNKWVNRGLNLFRKGIDMQFYVTVELDKAISQTTPDSKFSLPNKPFKETADLHEFLSLLPVPKSEDSEFDD